MLIIKTSDQSGFTLLEVLIALFIFSVGILGVNAMQLTSITGNSRASFTSEASNLAADQIELFMSLDYSDPALVDGDGDGTGQDANNDGIDDNGGNFGLDDVTAATADGNFRSGAYQIFWNVAVDYPILGAKTVQVFVDPPGAGPIVSMQIVKAELYH